MHTHSQISPPHCCDTTLLPEHRERWEVQICIVPPYVQVYIQLCRKTIIALIFGKINIFLNNKEALCFFTVK